MHCPLGNPLVHFRLAQGEGRPCQAYGIRMPYLTPSLSYPSQLVISQKITSPSSLLTRVNSTNVLDEGLRIGGIGRRMNSKVKISQTRHVSRINMVVNLDYSQSIPNRPLLAPIYRWPGLKELVRSDTYYNVCI
jgi:hypothetical protein